MSRVCEDSYDDLAEFHDVFMGPVWEQLRPRVRTVLGRCSEADVVVEIGAGSGMGTSVIAAECRAEIFAMEPNQVMRAMLLGRVGADADLAARVSVLPDGAPEGLAGLPDHVHAVVIAHVLGHLDAAQRSATWAALAQRLTPGAPILVTTQEPPTADTGDAVQTRRIGRHTYTARHHGGPTDLDRATFCTTYQVHHDGHLLRERTVRGRWMPLGLDVLRDEAAVAGLVTHEMSPGLALLRAAPPRD